jgi:hypothetical protein
MAVVEVPVGSAAPVVEPWVPGDQVDSRPLELLDN